MRIKLSTSGGVAALPGLAMNAEVNFSGNTARVSETGGGYARDLTIQETQEVRQMLDTGRFFQLPEELRSLNESGPRSTRISIADQPQYDITIQLDDGQEHTVRASGMMNSELERLSPGLGKFLEWAMNEFNKIKDYKIQQ